jgi:hypothetical protein
MGIFSSYRVKGFGGVDRGHEEYMNPVGTIIILIVLVSLGLWLSPNTGGSNPDCEQEYSNMGDGC